LSQYRSLSFFTFYILHVCIIGQNTVPDQLGHGYEFEGNGKDTAGFYQEKTFAKIALDEHTCLELDEIKRDKALLSLFEAQQSNVSKWSVHYNLGGTTLDNAVQREVLKDLKNWALHDSLSFCSLFDVYRSKGEDQKGNVHYTGYYLPVIEASLSKDAVYQYPIYKYPKGVSTIPDRAGIDTRHELSGKGLEIVYSKDLLANYLLQVQGSGYVRLPNDSLLFLAYNGTNKKAYRSLGKLFLRKGILTEKNVSTNAIKAWFLENADSVESFLNTNPSYVFFKETTKKPAGSIGIPLIEDHSIAIDSDYLPYNSVFMGEKPIIDSSGKCSGHRLTFLFSHDTGGAIQGPGHLDLFSGTGSEGEEKSNNLHHYGKLYLILPAD
jgi:membrane-bound lytic murein transglycosylase A